MVCRARVVSAKTGAYSVLKSRTATIRCWWAGGVLPPDLYVGSEAIVVGKLVTYDNGEVWRLSDALMIRADANWRDVMEPVFRRLNEYIVDPAEYVPKEVIDMYRYRKPMRFKRNP